jgi:hypothetical protein
LAAQQNKAVNPKAAKKGRLINYVHNVVITNKSTQITVSTPKNSINFNHSPVGQYNSSVEW